MASSSETTVNLLGHVAEDSRGPGEPGPLTVWGAFAGLAFLLDALLLPGLRGTVNGASSAIDSLSMLDALLAQLLFVAGVILAVHLQIGLVRSKASWALRALSIPITTVCLTLLINASVDELAALPLVLVSALAALLALGVGLSSSLRRNTGAAPIRTVLLLAGVTTVLSTFARLAAWQATTLEPPLLPTWSPWLASAAWWLSALLTLGSLRYLARTVSSPARALLSLGAVAVAVSWSATLPAGIDASSWHVFATRAASGLLREPAPLVPPPLALLEHLLALGAAAWAFTHRGLPPTQRVLFGYCLIALRAPDVPLFALGLLMAALFAGAPRLRGAIAPTAEPPTDGSALPDDAPRGSEATHTPDSEPQTG